MAAILILGDSQAGNPGAAAKAALEARGHQVVQIHHDGQSPVVYARDQALWGEYVAQARGKDLVLLVFGHNSPAGAATRNALIHMRDGVSAPVMMSGPPLYPNQNDRTIGDALKAQNAGVFGHRYIDAYPSTPANLPRDAPGWHLTRASAQGWGTAMAAAVEAALAPGGAATRPFAGGYDLLPLAAAALVGTAIVGVIAAALTWRRR